MDSELFDQAARDFVAKNRAARELASQQSSRLISIMMGNTSDTLEDFNDELAAGLSEALGEAEQAESSSSVDGGGGSASEGGGIPAQ